MKYTINKNLICDFFLLFPRNCVNDSRDFSYQQLIRTRRQNKPTIAPETKKSTPNSFNENEAFDTSVNTVYSDRPMSNFEGTFF